jgi:hypothetical protein
MTEPDPEFDAVHPSGHLVFRSCRGGYLHSVALAEAAMDTDAATLAEAVLRTAAVSHLKAVTQIRGEILDAGFTPSGDLSTEDDLEAAQQALQDHRLTDRSAR